MKKKDLDYPPTIPFEQKFKNSISKKVTKLYNSHFSSNFSSSTVLKKIMKQNKLDVNPPCEFLCSNFKAYQQNSKIRFTLKNLFINGTNLSIYLDEYYQTNKKFFDFDIFNKKIEVLKNADSEYCKLKKLLQSENKLLILLFGFPGSGKSLLWKNELSSIDKISKVKLKRIKLRLSPK